MGKITAHTLGEWLVAGRQVATRDPDVYLHVNPWGDIAVDRATLCLGVLEFPVQSPSRTWLSSSGTEPATHDIFCENKLRLLLPTEEKAPVASLLLGDLVQLGVPGSDHVLHTRRFNPGTLRATLAHGPQLMQGGSRERKQGEWIFPQGTVQRSFLPSLSSNQRICHMRRRP